MDPLYYLTQIPPQKIDDNLEVYTKPFESLSSGIIPEVVFQKINLKEEPNYRPPCLFYPEDKYIKMDKLKNIHSTDEGKKYGHVAYPYEKLGNSIFMNRCGLKLANIDKIFNLTNHNFGSLNLKNPQEFTFCDVAGGPGGFSQYLQWRLPNAMGYGITSKNHIDWNMDGLDPARLVNIYGINSAGSGDLYTEWEFFINLVTRNKTTGVDLVVADGGFDVSKSHDFIRQEFISSRLILIEILIGMICCKPGAHFICKIFDTVTKISADMIYLCSLVFEKIHIFKPTTSRWGNSERYLVCMSKKKQDATPIVDFVKRMVQMQTDDIRISDSNLVLPSSFIVWLTERNTESMAMQQDTAFKLLDIIQKKYVTIPKVDLHKFLILLDVPGNKSKK